MILNGEDIWGLFYEPEIQNNDQDVIQFVDQSYGHEVVSWLFLSWIIKTLKVLMCMFQFNNRPLSIDTALVVNRLTIVLWKLEAANMIPLRV
jgi:hypothetical protein